MERLVHNRAATRAGRVGRASEQESKIDRFVWA